MIRFRFGILVDVIDLKLQSIMLELSDDIGQWTFEFRFFTPWLLQFELEIGEMSFAFENLFLMKNQLIAQIRTLDERRWNREVSDVSLREVWSRECDFVNWCSSVGDDRCRVRDRCFSPRCSSRVHSSSPSWNWSNWTSVDISPRVDRRLERVWRLLSSRSPTVVSDVHRDLLEAKCSTDECTNEPLRLDSSRHRSDSTIDCSLHSMYWHRSVPTNDGCSHRANQRRVSEKRGEDGLTCVQ